MSRLVCTLITIAGLLISSISFAAYPTKPIRLIVPFAAGGSVDIIARVIGEKISESLGQSVIVENKPGAASAIGTEYAARSVPDGYTLLMGSTSSLAINPSLRALPYDPLRDFVPVALIASVPHVLAVSENSPFATLSDFLAYARANPQKVNYGSVGAGSPHHLAGVMLNQMAGLRMVDIPYRGTSPLLTDLAGGQVMVASVDIAPALSYIKTGRIKALALATKKRTPLAQDIPTTAEAGLPGFEVTGWYGIVAPTGVPVEVVSRLSKAISDALAQPEMHAKLESMGATPEGGTAADFGAHLERESSKWAAVIKSAGIKLD